MTLCMCSDCMYINIIINIQTDHVFLTLRSSMEASSSRLLMLIVVHSQIPLFMCMYFVLIIIVII